VRTVVLVGNPNAGKTTLFNALTGMKQRVGNWSGVTVEKVSGFFTCEDIQVEVMDLPGIYGLVGEFQDNPYLSEDEKLTQRVLAAKAPDLILNVVDARYLARNLYLTTQLVEQGWPVVVVLTHAETHNTPREDVLSKALGCPVLSVSANIGQGIADLQLLLDSKSIVSKKTIFNLSSEDNDNNDIETATKRYAEIDALVASLPPSKASQSSKKWSATLDKWILHRYLGVPFFLIAMYSMFVFAIHIGGVFQDFFDQITKIIFVDGAASALISIGAPNWLISLVAHGIGQGLNTTLTFIPVIGAMFFALAFLEDSGYMARAAFVMDRVMRSIGLPGKSFVPLIVGFGCNVPAIMGARTLENKRDKILTVMISPFMSCGARLAIFTVFVSAFFAKGQNIIFLLYLIGIAMAMMTGFLLKKTLLKGTVSPLLLELPQYQFPPLKLLCRHAWYRLKHFISNAAKLIVPISMLLALLGHVGIDGHWQTPHKQDATIQQPPTLMMAFGQAVTPIFHPMGVQDNNWPATVGLLTGVLAKEVVIGTLNSLYGLEEPELDKQPLGKRIGLALKTIPENIVGLGGALLNPIEQAAPIEEENTNGVGSVRGFGVLNHHFGTVHAAFAYLLFVLLYFPCVATTAAMVREVRKQWAIFSVCWTTVLAYTIAVLYFQIATYALHPVKSSIWIGSISLFYGLVWLTLKWMGHQQEKKQKKLLPTRIVLV
jgi:ferrous iron transport protein B